MATSFVGPLVVESAFSAAPRSRAPQPTSARLPVLLSPAYIRGSTMFARAVAAATLPVVLRSSRRVSAEFTESLMEITSARRVVGFAEQAGKAGENRQRPLYPKDCLIAKDDRSNENHHETHEIGWTK